MDLADACRHAYRQNGQTMGGISTGCLEYRMGVSEKLCLRRRESGPLAG